MAPTTDLAQLAVIQADVARVGLLPTEQVVDAGYIRGRNLDAIRQDQQIDLVGPIYADRQWHAQANAGFDVAHVQIDWEAHVVTCPQGRPSLRWCATHTVRVRTPMHVDCSAADGPPGPVRTRCTRAKALPRSLTLQPQAAHEAVQAARQRRATPEFAERYACRAGSEGTISQGVRAFGLRRARYRGLAKTHV